MELLEVLVNHIPPSGPAAIPYGALMLGWVKLDTAPAGVIRPIAQL